MVTTKSKLPMEFNKEVKPLDIEAKKPRICGRQIMRDNVEAESPEDYFRKSITVPFLYCTLKHLLCSLMSSALNLRFLMLCLYQVIFLVVIL
jgi:hypothetical protein